MRSRRGLVVALLAVATATVIGYSFRRTWLQYGAEWLVCAATESTADAALIDNVDPNYPLFDAAGRLQARGRVATVLVPILRSPSVDVPVAVTRGIVDLMCTTAGVERCQVFETPSSEPISLNLARHVADELGARGMRSILLVTPGLRSQRAFEVYRAVLGSRGITVHCHPVFGAQDASNWFETAHGVQDVVLQFLKLWYYRLFVLDR